MVDVLLFKREVVNTPDSTGIVPFHIAKKYIGVEVLSGWLHPFA